MKANVNEVKDLKEITMEEMEEVTGGATSYVLTTYAMKRFIEELVYKIRTS